MFRFRLHHAICDHALSNMESCTRSLEVITSCTDVSVPCHDQLHLRTVPAARVFFPLTDARLCNSDTCLATILALQLQPAACSLLAHMLVPSEQIRTQLPHMDYRLLAWRFRGKPCILQGGGFAAHAH